MTANKHFKRRVRERARRTGESYTAALRHLRHTNARENLMQWQRIEKPDFGYAVQVPAGWEEQPPDLKNSPLETARFGEPGDRRRGLIVFRGMPGRPFDPVQAAERAQYALTNAGFGDFQLTETRVAGRPGARLNCAKYDAGRVWAVREYFVAEGDLRLVLGCGSAVPEEDEVMFEAMAERFEILTPA
jgi:hypothetical protein